MTKKKSTALTNKKINGRIYTPDYIVNNILDLCNYNGNNILQKHIIDNSCGDGAFLCEIVRRYCKIARNNNISDLCLSKQLSEYIHGIEIDEFECEKCIENLSKIAATFNIYDVNWDICVGDTLIINKYNNRMDYVVGNPPYVRVHNLIDNYDTVKKYSFAQNGMTDLFIVFYEIGLKMLNNDGILGYISPSSLFNSIASISMRKYITNYNNIKAIVDLKHFQPFEATTYTTIVILTKKPQKTVMYYEYDKKKFVPSLISELSYDDFYINGSFIFGNKLTLNNIKKILFSGNNIPICEVKNGFATLYDDFFIGEWDFNDYTIPIVKASTGKVKKCLYPYDKNGKLIPFNILTKNKIIEKHYEIYTEKLKNRSLDSSSDWYGFGRRQGINDVYKKKYIINTLVRDVKDIKLSECSSGVGVYSGLYILTEFSIKDLESIIFTDEFINYIKMLGKYKSGGYYTFSSKDLQKYINYKLSERSSYCYEQLTIS